MKFLKKLKITVNRMLSTMDYIIIKGELYQHGVVSTKASETLCKYEILSNKFISAI